MNLTERRLSSLVLTLFEVGSGISFNAYVDQNFPGAENLQGHLSFLSNGDIQLDYTFFGSGKQSGKVTVNESRVISMNSCDCTSKQDMTTCGSGECNAESACKKDDANGGFTCQWYPPIKKKPKQPPTNPQASNTPTKKPDPDPTKPPAKPAQ